MAENEEDFVALNEQLQNDLTTAQASLTETGDKLTSAEAKVVTLEADAVALNETNATLTTTNTEVTARADTAEARVTELEAQVSTLTDSQADFDKSVSEKIVELGFSKEGHSGGQSPETKPTLTDECKAAKATA